MHGDRGDIVLGWLARITVALSLLGVVAFEAVSIAVTRVSTKDAATNAAFEASQTWHETHDVERAYIEASAYAIDHGGTIEPDEFTVDDDGRVTLTMRRTATSLLLDRFATGREWLAVAETGTGKATSS